MNATQLCSDLLANTARKLAKKTKTTQHVIDVSKGGGKGFQKIVSDPINYTREGVITVLFTAEAK